VKVLISAYACEPDKGSEPGVGWNWAVQLSRFHEVWVITRGNNRNSIKNELCRVPNPNLHFVYADLPVWLSFWKKGQKGIYIYYFLWQAWAYREARRLQARERFDAVHHVTFGTVWLPTLMTLLNVPFIWGPIGGAEAVPRGLRKHMAFKWRAYERLRDLIIRWTFSWDPLARLAAKKARMIIVRTKITRDAFSSEVQKKIRLMIETGVSREFLEEMKTRRPPRSATTVLMAGRLLHWKGFDIGIEAFLKVCDGFPGTRLLIVGSGPEKERLQALAGSRAEEGRVFFTGQLPREEALRTMKEADVFLMPSMKDAGAWVLYEAMASGLPVVCLDYAGPGEIVDDSCAFSIPISARSEVVRKTAEALSALLSSDSLRRSMGAASISRLEAGFLWEKKGEMIRDFYSEAFGPGGASE
jgi:glycosyltransferase involved in cell wall biosynthesis